jgi:hypothetical protein
MEDRMNNKNNIRRLTELKRKIEFLLKNEIELDIRIPTAIINNLLELNNDLRKFLDQLNNYGG